MDKNFDIYPLTITKDRYTGVYSGGEWFNRQNKLEPTIIIDIQKHD